MKKITLEQFCGVLDFLRRLTDEDIDFSVQSDDSVVLYYRNYSGDFVYENIETDKDKFIEDPRVAELKKDILDAEERLTDLKEELAKLTQE